MPSAPPVESAPATAQLSDAKRRLLAQRLRSASPPRLQPSIQPRTSNKPAPITSGQYSLWLDSTLQPELPTYNEAVTLTFSCDIDPATLELAINAFIARHEIWRTTFSISDGEVVQQVHANLCVRLPFTDLTHLPAAKRETESLRLAGEQASSPIDPEAAPLLRGRLVQLAPGDTRLHLALHHLIFDGFSLRRTFLPELEALYRSFESHTSANLPAATLQYSDFAAWQREQVDSPAQSRHLLFWRRKLAGSLPVSQLPLDRPRPATLTHRGDVVRFSLSRALTVALAEIARARGATLYMALLATLKALLFRYSGQPDIVVGTVADGRTKPELESMMGYLLQVFAVRTAPTFDLSFSGYLDEVKHSLLEAHEASTVPFERVVAALQDDAQREGHAGRRDFSHTPIFQTLFAFQPTASSASSWEIANTEISLGISKFDLYLEADEQPTETKVRIFFSTALFDATTIERMAGHWTTLIEAAVRAPGTPLGDLPLLTEGEREEMLLQWNDTAAPIPDETLHGLFAARARRCPDAPAVSFEGTALSYAELDRESTSLAQRLQKAGAGPGTLVAVFLDRSHHMVAALLAVLKTGAAYMPLDPGTPAARIALCLQDGEPAVVLTSRTRVADLPGTSAAVLILDDLLEGEQDCEALHCPNDPDALAYVIHTSGSTGRPKGVELRHRGVVNFLLSMQSNPGFSAADTLVALTTISFDIAVLELFLPLVTGGRTVIASRETALDPTSLAALIESSAATVVQATPATWSALTSIDWQPTRRLKVLCGGEAMNRTLADRLLALNVDLWNVYGPTETTVWSTLYHVKQGKGAIPVGRPLANTSAYILDARLQPVPINIPGELYLGGTGVARGYRNQPAMTAQKFISNPFAGRGGDSVLYRTGDLAVYRAGGVIECQGRADNQVKIRGHRIELEDVEMNLTAHPQVLFAAAKAWPEASGGHFLCAYLVGVEGSPPNASELRQFLRNRVADYMIPSEMMALPSMPLTGNGKVDRSRLAPPVRTPVALRTSDESTLTGTELRLARLWAQLLHVDAIAAEDNFFDLGGHSLLLLKLLRLIAKEFGVELTMSRLFQASTLAGLAALIDQPAAERATLPHSAGAIVAVHTNGTQRPLFLIHSLMLYGRLPAALGQDQPSYGLDTHPFEASSGEDWVETMLEDHVAQIKRIQPHGPYQLAGWCFAGLMAYEVARRLEERGETVSMLALFDSWNPCRTPGGGSKADAKGAPADAAKVPGKLQTMLWKWKFHVRQLRAAKPAERRGYLRRMVRETLKTTFVPISRRAKSKLFRACNQLALPMPSFLRDPWVVTYEWLARYEVRPYRGDITLLRPAAIPVPPSADAACGWRDFTSGNISSTFIPGDRSTMFLMPNLAVLARELSNRMSS